MLSGSSATSTGVAAAARAAAASAFAAFLASARDTFAGRASAGAVAALAALARRNQYASTGTIVSETKREATSAIVTVSANGRNSSPVMSPTKASGRNTATVVIVDAVIAPATSRTAVMMEKARPSGLLSRAAVMCRLMFSMTTMESSTTRPIAMVSAPRVRMLSVYPVACSPMNVMSTDVGIEMAVTRVARMSSRKIRMMSTANARPSSPSVASDSIDSSMYGAWSKTTTSSTSEPRASSRSGMSARTPFETSTVFAAGSLVTAMVSAGSPLTREMLVTGLSVNATDATSPMTTTSPGSVCPTRGSAAMSSTEPSLDPVCTAKVLSSSVICPAGSSTPFCWRVRLIAVEVRPAS